MFSSSRTVRVFLSSTFRDFAEERDLLVRQYFPKGYDFRKITPERLAEVEEEINERPRKTLGYACPRNPTKQQTNNTELEEPSRAVFVSS